MELITFKRLARNSFGLLLLLLACNKAMATAYQYVDGVGLTPAFTGGTTEPPIPPTATIPQFANGDSVTVVSGNMFTPSSSAMPYTLGVTSSGTAIALNLQVDLGATLGYNGTSPSGAAYFSSRNDNGTTTSTIGVDGTVAIDNGLYSFYIANTNATPDDTYNINLSDTAFITGSILTNNVKAPSLNITGEPTINGVINLGTSAAGISTLNIGSLAVASFTPTQSISNIGFLHISNASTMTLNVTNSNIKAVTVDILSTLSLNTQLNGITSGGDGNITNNGTMNIAANIAKTGGFAGIGTNNITEAVTIDTSTYQIANHKAVMSDLYNYGNMTLTTANFKLNNGGTNTFEVVYGTGVAYGNGYTAGYFPGGTYTLVTTTTGTITTPTFSAKPDSTLFLSFSNPTVVGTNQIQITLTRTPFSNYGQNSLTETIGATLEIIGNNNPITPFVSLLDAVEASTTATQTDYALRQLAPLANAPYYGYILLTETMTQVKLRLAEERNGTTSHYFAGDIGADNHIWIRPFGSYGNQQPKQDSLGYYASCGGMAIGFDRNLDENYTMGAAFVYALAHVNDKINPQSSTDIKSYNPMFYGTYDYQDGSYLDWVLAFTINNFTANRLVNINGLFSTVASSAYNSQQFAVLAKWGKDYEAFGFMQLTPMMQAQYTFVKQYTYTETNGGPANLTISRSNSDVLSLGVGGAASIPVFVDPSIIIPEIHGMVYYNPIIGKQNTTFSFVAGGGPMVSIFDLSRTAAEIGFGFTIAVIEKLELKFNINYEVADRFNGYNVFLNLRYFL